jgi:hypothetical protein
MTLEFLRWFLLVVGILCVFTGIRFADNLCFVMGLLFVGQRML